MRVNNEPGTPDVVALGVNRMTCQVVLKTDRKGRTKRCDHPASFRMTWDAIPGRPLYICVECYEHGRKRDRDVPSVSELRQEWGAT